VISRTIYPKRRGRRALRLAAIGGLAVALLTVVGVAFAVHDLEFQLDGDASATTTTSINGTQDSDWDSLFNADGTTKGSLPTGFGKADLTKDFNNTGTTFLTNDTSTYTTGSKDTLPISTGWQCTYSNNVNSKIDIMNAYAAQYTAPSGDQILYFALERNTNTGDANVGFWFLQDEVGCATTGSTASFTGEHHDGDVLIVSAFTKGGDVSTISAYRWDGNDATGSLRTTPIASGADCRSATQPIDDPICAAANNINDGTGGTITVPWLTANFKDGVGHALRTGEFFEGGINLTDTGLAGKCFNSFLGDTRSSQSLTATLFDYAGGTIGECSSSTTTQAQDGSGASLTSVDIPTTGTLSVQDTATVSVSGVDSFSSNVAFYLCGPSATAITTCATADGVKIGASKAITANGSVTSDTATLTSAGSYCWHAVFAGDSSVGVPSSEDDGTNECFTVNPLQPVLSTTATSGPVAFGESITDTISLTGTADQPGSGGDGPGGTINTTRGDAAGGSISLTVYGPDSCSTVAHTATLAVSGDSTTYGGVGSDAEFTPASPGQYVFVASYDGDSPNTLGVDATACAAQPDAEKVTVQQIPSTISTAQKVYPQDSATVASSVSGDKLPAGGTVTFRLYDSLTSCQAHGTTIGSGGLLYSEAKTIATAANSVTLGTSNTSVALDANGTYYWWVTYATGDSAHTGRQSDCAESTALTFVNDAGSGTLFP
jgi:hypothetical protein